MGKQYDVLSETLLEFIAAQKVFFVGTATADSRVNVSPKGMDAFRVLSSNRVPWLNLTGSGNETSAHVPHYTCTGGRPMLEDWAIKKGDEGLR